MVNPVLAMSCVCAAFAVLSPQRVPSIGSCVHDTSDNQMHSLDEVPSVSLLEEDGDVLVVDGSTGGISHVKARSPFELALAESASMHVEEQVAEQAAMRALQSVLDSHEPGSLLDKSTPKDGHCMFHALRSAGLLQDCQWELDIASLRRVALRIASQEQLEIAANSQHCNVAEYVARMQRDEYGDNLMIVLLAVCFDQPITVIEAESVRTWWPDGREECSADHSALWIAHRPELHYYGVIRASASTAAGPATELEPDAMVADCVSALHKRGLSSLVPGSLVETSSLDMCVPRKRIRGKCQRHDVSSALVLSSPEVLPVGKAIGKIPECKRPGVGTKKLKDVAGFDKARLCGNCGTRGHNGVSCPQPCFACGGDHRYYQCSDPDLHGPALRQARRNRVAWEGFGSLNKDASKRKGMKPSGAGHDWVRKEYDPEYTPARDVSPKRAVLNKFGHVSDRARMSLRILWSLSEEDQMRALLDGGFLTDKCLDLSGSQVVCPGLLDLYCTSTDQQAERKLRCSGVPHKQRHTRHWLHGSVFAGHTRLSASDVSGMLLSFAASKNIEATAIDTGLHRSTVGELFDRLRMAACLVAEDQRDRLVFSNCQIEIDESVIRKERVYDKTGIGRKRVATIHHSVLVMSQRGSTRQVLYVMEPKRVEVDAQGKPGPPPPPSDAMVVQVLLKHLGDFVVVHTDGAPAYRSACARLVAEGFMIVHDYVVHSDHQYTAFGRHDLTGVEGWEHCEFAIVNEQGQRRIRVIKGVEKVEGFWRHLKHGNSAVPEEVHNDDRRLNLYAQALVWRMQTCGDPYRDTLRMCRAFRELPLAKKQLVFEFGLRAKAPGAEITKSGKPKMVHCKALPPVLYCSANDDCDEDEDDVEDP